MNIFKKYIYQILIIFLLGLLIFGYSLNKNEVTLAQELKKIGYSTGHFGKWHLNGVRGPGVPIFEDDEYNPGEFGLSLLECCLVAQSQMRRITIPVLGRG